MADSSATKSQFTPDEQHLGSLYADALLGAAGSDADDAVAELESFVVDVIEKMPKFESVLTSPRVPVEAKTEMLDKAFGKMSKTVLNFLKVVVTHGRMNSIQAIAVASRQMLNEHQGRVEVLVKTATELDPKTADDVKAKLSQALNKEVVLKTAIDEEMIGGIVLQVGDTVYDGSISNQLKQLRRGIVNRTAEEIRESTDRFIAS